MQRKGELSELLCDRFFVDYRLARPICPKLIALALRQFKVIRYILKRENAGIDQLFEFLRAAPNARNIVASIAWQIGIRILKGAAMPGSPFVYTGTRTLWLDLIQEGRS